MYKVMLCEQGTSEQLDKLQGYAAETKWDGERVVFTDKGLFNRRMKNITSSFPEIGLPKLGWVFDGEIICDTFSNMQSRIHLANGMKIKQSAKENPCKGMLFDCLFANGVDVRSLPYEERKKQLVTLMLDDKLPKGCEVEIGCDTPRRLFERVVKKGGEGIVMKKLGSPYLGKRSNLWMKIKAWKEMDVDVTGYTSEIRTMSALITSKGKVNMSLPETAYRHWVHDIQTNGTEGLKAKVKYLEDHGDALRFPILKELYRE